MVELKLETKLKSLCDVVSDLEKSEHSLINQLLKYKDFELNKYIRDIENQRNNEYKDIKTTINNVIEKLNEKLKLFQDRSFPEIEEIPKFKHDMLNIQHSIIELKRSSESKMYELQDEEEILVKDLETIKEEIEKPKKKLDKSKKKLPTLDKNVKKPSGNKKLVLDQETQEFVDFITAINDNHHKISRNDIVVFYKTAKKSNDLDELFENFLDVKSELENEIISSLTEWYAQFVHLKEEEKRVYSKWRLSKIKQKQNKENAFKRIDNQLDLVTLKENLIDWKKSRDEDRKSKTAYDNFFNMENKRKEINEINKRSRVKSQISQWKKECEKIDKAQKIKDKQPKKPKQTGVNKKIKQYQQKDEEFILKMQKAKKNIKVIKEVNSPKNKIEVKKDSQRIHKMTKQWLNRIKDKEPRYKPSKEIKAVQKFCDNVNRILIAKSNAEKLKQPSFKSHIVRLT
ncbi:unnamed protein product [Brassicogethes aeneus]|uniref:Coiled-coil domain-containing protein 112-like n=1 Tax=Brassicogethes aeneus TaxID=1431903 RepID=A0A9P0AX26_BRAAE|nr:unnamed protein product [Brassicogethes aeneus]